MKILITENQLDKIIDNYITIEMGGAVKKQNKKSSGSIFYVNPKSKSTIAEYRIEGSNYTPKFTSELWIHSEIWDSISNMFGFEYGETKRAIQIWIQKHWKLKYTLPKRLGNHNFFQISNF